MSVSLFFFPLVMLAVSHQVPPPSTVSPLVPGLRVSVYQPHRLECCLRPFGLRLQGCNPTLHSYCFPWGCSQHWTASVAPISVLPAFPLPPLPHSPHMPTFQCLNVHISHIVVQLITLRGERSRGFSHSCMMQIPFLICILKNDLMIYHG